VAGRHVVIDPASILAHPHGCLGLVSCACPFHILFIAKQSIRHFDPTSILAHPHGCSGLVSCACRFYNLFIFLKPWNITGNFPIENQESSRTFGRYGNFPLSVGKFSRLKWLPIPFVGRVMCEQCSETCPTQTTLFLRPVLFTRLICEPVLVYLDIWPPRQLYLVLFFIFGFLFHCLSQNTMYLFCVMADCYM
jgi:hypothetical protein